MAFFKSIAVRLSTNKSLVFNKDEKAKVLGEIATEFRKYYLTNKIYFSKEVCAAVDELWTEAIKPIQKYGFWRVREDRNSEDARKAMDTWENATNTMIEKIPRLLHKIEDEFRILLGVESA